MNPKTSKYTIEPFADSKIISVEVETENGIIVLETRCIYETTAEAEEEIKKSKRRKHFSALYERVK